jgi:hypothetical protein
MCRTELPPGPEKLFEEATRLYFMIERKITRVEAAWGALTAEEQKRMDEVFEMWMKAATQGHAMAQFNLGCLYQQGRGVAQSDGAAVRWYQKSADQGHAGAQNNLGFMNFEGTGVAQNDEEALRWYRKAKDQGNTLSHFNLLGFVRNRSKGVTQSDVEATRLYRKAADQGDAKAQFVLSACSYHGKGVEKNLAVAHKYLSLSAAQGNEQATQVLSNLFPRGAPLTTQPSAASFVSTCARCGIVAADLKACVRCKAVVYCGRACQVAHWKAGHKQDCTACEKK